MGIIRTIVMGFLILLVIVTFITDTKLSSEYYKAMAKSGIKLGKWVGGLFSRATDKYRVKEVEKEVNDKDWVLYDW